MSYVQLVKEVGQLFDVNHDLEFVRRIRSFAFCDKDEMLLITFCHLFVNNGDDNIGWNDHNFLYDDNRTRIAARSELYCDSHILIKTKMIEHACDDGFVFPSYGRKASQ